jgi:hypothetical protein
MLKFKLDFLFNILATVPSQKSSNKLKIQKKGKNVLKFKIKNILLMIAKINENIEMVLGDIFFFAKK